MFNLNMGNMGNYPVFFLSLSTWTLDSFPTLDLTFMYFRLGFGLGLGLVNMSLQLSGILSNINNTNKGKG